MGIFERGPNDAGHAKLNPILKLALELGPLGVFFFGNAYGDAIGRAIPPLGALGGRLFVGTALFIVATVLALAVSFALTRRLPIMPFVSGIVVLVFGSLSIWFQNEEFIKIKPTIIYCLFGGTLLGGLLFGDRCSATPSIPPSVSTTKGGASSPSAGDSSSWHWLF